MGLTQDEFAKRSGLSRTNIAKWETDTVPSQKSIERIADFFNVPASDLVFKNMQTRHKEDTKPPALKEASHIYVPEDSERYSNRFGVIFVPLDDGRYLMGVPLVPQYVKGGPMAGFADAEYFDELPKHWVTVERIHRGKYLAFDVYGDSMDYDGRDYIANGARLTVREIRKDLWAGSKLHLNHFKDFVIEYSEGICVKRIIKHDLEQYTITCSSLNPDKVKYPDFVLNLNEVANLFNVIKVDNPR